MPWYAKAKTVHHPFLHGIIIPDLKKAFQVKHALQYLNAEAVFCFAKDVSKGPWFPCLGPIHTHTNSSKDRALIEEKVNLLFTALIST